MYDNNNKYIIYADEHYKLSRKRINNEIEREEIENNVLCMFYWILKITISLLYNKQKF